MTEKEIKALLGQVKYPGFSRDIVSFGLVKGIAINEGQVQVSIALTTADMQIPAAIKRDVEAVLKGAGCEAPEALISVSRPQTPSNDKPEIETMQKVRYAIAVASGKGGVGKSSVTVNLACALDQLLEAQGKPNAVGIMDCDIYGPSVPLMMGVNQQPEIEDDLIVPVENFGVRVISMGLLIDETTPVVWRGPMIMKTIQQFAANVDWGELEILLIDLPPGTGDAQLTLVQTIPLEGAIIVTTPQTASVNVARRGAGMFEKVGVPLMGVVENMSYLELPGSGEKQYLFGEGGGALTAHDLDTQLLGQVPLDQDLRIGGDRGIPIVKAHPDSSASQAFDAIAKQILDKVTDQ